MELKRRMNMKKTLTLLVLCSMTAFSLKAQTPNITSVIPVATSIGRYEKFEIKVVLNGTIANPYDYDELVLRGVFTAPSGRKDTIEGFYMQNFDLNTTTGSLTTTTNSYLIRFSPNEIGTWNYSLTLTTSTGTSAASTGTFQAINANAKGFIRKNTTNYLSFDNGEQYIPIGQNLAWQNKNPYLDYKKWLERMGAAKANFMRLWLCHWGVGLEWKSGTGGGFDGLKKYKQNNAWYIDYIVEKCKEQGIYMMFCINHHGQVSTTTNSNWAENPYNTANGGPCSQTVNFFDNAAAKALHKNRLRYIIARWGYSTQIMSWELFNEVSYTDNYATPSVKTAVRDWHIEMAQYLKQKDPAKHLITTSFSGEEDLQLWQKPEMDFTQNHSYVDAANIESILAEISRNNIKTFEKPTLNGEFGIDPNNVSLSTIDPNGIHIHNALWGTALSGAMGGGGTWWWDSYMEPRDLYYHFKPLSIFLANISLKTDNYKTTKATSTGGNNIGELSISPGSGWGQATSANFTIDGAGSINPSVTQLSVFLYGSTWNTQYRNPPIFNVNYTNAGQFQVKTGSQAGEKPTIAIYLDGTLAFSAPNALPNQTYSINVPPGQHAIKVDNLGTDWINIASYEFKGIVAAPFNIYALKSADSKKITGWIHNRKYNWKDVGASGIPAAVSGVSAVIEGISNGSYEVKFYDCSTGNAVSTLTSVLASSEKLTFTVPAINWDLAFIATQTTTKTSDIAQNALKIYPNPIRQGDILRVNAIARNEATDGDYQIEIISVNGQILKTEKINISGETLEIGTHDLPRGYLILKISHGNAVSVGRFIVN